jgi:hypothetical protein
MLEAVDGDHGEAHVDGGLLPDVDASAIALEHDAMRADRRAVLQDGERVSARVIGQSRHRHGQQRRRDDPG